MPVFVSEDEEQVDAGYITVPYISLHLTRKRLAVFNQIKTSDIFDYYLRLHILRRKNCEVWIHRRPIVIQNQR